MRPPGPSASCSARPPTSSSSGAPDLGPAVRSLIERLALAVEDLEAFGAFLVVEVWVGDRGTPVRVVSPPEGSSTATALVEALGRVEGIGIPELVDDPAPAPPGYAPRPRARGGPQARTR